MRPLHIGKSVAGIYKAWIESPLGTVFGWCKTVNVPADNTQGYGVGALLLDRTSGQPQINWGTYLLSKFRPLSGQTITLTATTDLGVAHANQNLTVIVDAAAGNATYTLPPSTGHGNVIRFVVAESTGGNNLIINPAGSDKLSGTVHTISDDAGAAVKGYIGAASSHLTLNGTTTGGTVAGETIFATDDLLGTWTILGFTASTGTEATPFS